DVQKYEAGYCAGASAVAYPVNVRAEGLVQPSREPAPLIGKSGAGAVVPTTARLETVRGTPPNPGRNQPPGFPTAQPFPSGPSETPTRSIPAAPPGGAYAVGVQTLPSDVNSWAGTPVFGLGAAARPALSPLPATAMPTAVPEKLTAPWLGESETLTPA